MARAKRIPVGKSASGIWRRETSRGDRYDFKHPDGKIKGGHTSLKEARATRAKMFADASTGTWRPPSSLTLKEYAERWLDRRKPGATTTSDGRLERQRLSPATFEGYDLNIKRHVLPKLGDRPLQAIRTDDVDDLIADLERSLAAGTVRNIIVPLRKMLNDAVRSGHIPANPAANANLPPAQNFGGQEVPRKHTEAIREALIARAPGDDLFYVHLFDVALGAGLRLGELRALRWTDYDRDKKLLRIRRAYSRRVLKAPKSDAGKRSIPVFPSVETALQALAARAVERGRYAPDELIFPTSAATALHDSNFRRRVWEPALRTVGLSEQDEEGRWHPRYRLHDLRHTCASRLIAEGCRDVKLIQALIGHSNAAILLNRYSHLTDDRVTEAASNYDPATEEQRA
jgi:integrase